MKYKLSDICEYAKGKIKVSALDENTYISTENMLPNKGGITEAASLPTQEQTQAFMKNDVLVSNIRPYFKKIWYATFDGGCSNDVLVFRAKDGVSSRFLHYVLADDTFFDYSMATSTLKKGLCAMGAVVGMVLVTNVINSGVSGLQGVFFGLGAAVLYAAVVLLNKKITDIPSRDRTVFQLGISAVTLLPYVMVKGNITSFTPEPLALSMLLMAGIVHTGIAYSLYFGSINRISAQTVALFSYIDPIVAVLLSAFVLHEPMTPVMAAGVVLVIVSAVVSEIHLTALNLFQ